MLVDAAWFCRLSRSLCKVLARAQELLIYMSCNDVVVVLLTFRSLSKILARA